jgi:glycosyltransferase involved in cell wall biosynthesis
VKETDLSNTRIDLKMRIIIVNPRYFISGGPERYMFNIKEVFESQGHTVIPFSIKHKLNAASEYEQYFLDPIGTGNEVYFSEYKKNNFKDIVHLIGRLFYSFEAKRKFSQLIRATKPHIIYILNFENKISPSIIDVAKNLRIPVVHRISDFAMICCTNIFYLYKQQTICEKCLKKGKYNLLLNKCSHDSLLNSFLKYFSYILHNLLSIEEKIDAFVIPSVFTISKYIEYGIPQGKIFHIPTFFNFKTEQHSLGYGDFALYIGRIDPDKGIMTLVDAFINTDYQLKIIGFSMSDFEVSVKKYLSNKKHNITFLGKMSFSEIEPYLKECCFTVLPSSWYDNFPNSILESYAFKKPVIATDIGSLKELVVNGKTGLLFKYRDPEDLKLKAAELFADKEKARVMGESGFIKLNSEYSRDTHIENLTNLFNSLI